MSPPSGDLHLHQHPCTHGPLVKASKLQRQLATTCHDFAISAQPLKALTLNPLKQWGKANLARLPSYP
jgi:hypothetical protein